MSAASAWTIHTRAYDKLEASFRQAASERIGTFIIVLEHHLQPLESIRAFFAASSEVDREEFANFTRPFLQNDREIKNLQWIPRVENADRPAVTAEAVTSGEDNFEFREPAPDGTMVLAAQRPVHYPILYTEPSSKNWQALGFDNAADPARKEAIEKAISTDREVITPGIVKHGELKRPRSEILILKPVYAKGQIGSESPRAAGVTAAVLSVRDLFATAMSGFEPAGLKFVLSDVTSETPEEILSLSDAGGGRGLIGDRSAGATPKWQVLKTFDYCDRTWEILAVPTRTPRAVSDKIAWVVFAAGLALTALMVAYLTALTRSLEHKERAAAASQHAAEALRSSEERVRSIIQTANDAFVTIGSDGSVEDWNKKAEAIFGWTREEAVGQSLAGLIVPEQYRDTHRAGMAHYAATGAGPVLNKRFEITALRRSGEEFPIELTIWPVRKEGGVIFSAFISDITERKRAEAQIRRNASYLDLTRKIALKSNQSASMDEAVAYCLKEVCELMGWPVGHMYRLQEAGEVILIPAGVWYLKDPQRYKPFCDISQNTRFPVGVGMPGRILQNKRPLWIPDVTQDTNFPRAAYAVQTGLKAGMGFPVMVEDRVTAVLEFFSEQAESETPEVLEIMGQIGNQIGRVMERERGESSLRKALEETRRANDELKRAQSKLIQADRLSAIGQLAAGVAHEINNPVGFVNSNLSSLRKYAVSLKSYQEAVAGLIDAAKTGQDAGKLQALAEDAAALGERIKLGFILNDMEPLIAESQSGLDRVKKIVMDLKTFTRADSKDGMDFADLNEVLEGTVSVVWNEIKYKAQVVKEFGGLPKVFCNRQQMGQVFINILVNAAQAMKDTGTITLRTYTKDEHICVDIEDTGTGIPADVIDHIFDPFFTTKEVGQGTGLGLGISYDIIKKHGGRIDVSTQLGVGTCFTIRLPLSSCPLPPKDK